MTNYSQKQKKSHYPNQRLYFKKYYKCTKQIPRNTQDFNNKWSQIPSNEDNLIYIKIANRQIKRQKSRKDKRAMSQIKSRNSSLYNFNILIKNQTMESSIISDAKHQETQQIEQKKQLSTQNTLYRFSSQHKPQLTTLQNNNTKAIQSSGWTTGLALIEGVVFEKGSSIKLRFQSIGDGSVGVGLGIRNVIINNKYLIPNYGNDIGHGCFLLLSDGYSFSHSNKEHNNIETDFYYRKGEVIKLERNGDELWWMNQSRKKEFSMKVKLTPDEWAQACFCVRIWCSSVVQIIK